MIMQTWLAPSSFENVHLEDVTLFLTGIHAGGLRYHGMSPILSLLYNLGFLEAQSYQQKAIFEAAMLFARTEGIVVAPKRAHAIKAAIEEAQKCSRRRRESYSLWH